MTSTELCALGTPVQAAGDHQMQNQPEIAVHADRNSLSDSAQLTHDLTFHILQRRFCGAEEEWTGDADLLDGLTENSRFECIDVCGDVGQFGHGKLKCKSF